jgi:hypothetical protein
MSLKPSPMSSKIKCSMPTLRKTISAITSPCRLDHRGPYPAAAQGFIAGEEGTCETRGTGCLVHACWAKFCEPGRLIACLRTVASAGTPSVMKLRPIFRL